MPRGKKADQKKDTAPAKEAPELVEDATPAQETPEPVEDAAPAQETQERDLFAGIQNPCVYCRPTVRGVVRQYTTCQGGIPDALRSFIKEHPDARRLIVSTAEFPAMRKRLDTPGTAEAKLYKQVKERITGSPRKPSEAGFVGKGGARERAQFSAAAGNGA